MTLVQIPSLAEIGAGIGLVAGGACDKASSAVQHFINTPSVAENGLNLLAAQIDVLEQLVAALRERSEEQRLNSSHVAISYAVFCLKKKIELQLTQSIRDE